MNGPRALPLFRAPFAPPDEELAKRFLAAAARDRAAEARIDDRARHLIEAIRAKAVGLGGIEDFLHAYSLSTKEGLALMVLAEALLRVPDSATADRLIEDKLAAGRWQDSDVKSTAILVSASAWTLGVAARIIHPNDTPETILDSVVRRLGQPAMRAAIRQAMRLLGSHFVIGQTIEEAISRARGQAEARYSFDMLGEGARTTPDAEKYFDAYAAAIAAIGKNAGSSMPPVRPGISVKLSALHPRYEAISRERVRRELLPRLIELVRLAKDKDLQFTVDAEEADRLELSLELIGACLDDPSFAGWDGFGLAVQAYQKRALAVIDWIEDAAMAKNRRLTVRLVKGAYWDTEIKRAQERGLADYPVFTRKPMTDLCYMACAKKLLAARNRLFPQFATHNALTVASVIEDAGGIEGFEFQRLYGMGDALYQALRAEFPDAACRIYAPVGGHRDLLAYLVRGFWKTAPIPPSCRSRPIPTCRSPTFCAGRKASSSRRRTRATGKSRSRAISIGRNGAARPASISATAPASKRCCARFGRRATCERRPPRQPHSSMACRSRESNARSYRRSTVPRSASCARPTRRWAFGGCRRAAGFPGWAATPIEERAAALERAADRLELDRGRILALLQNEGGRRSTMRSPNYARPWTIAAIMRQRRVAACAGADAGADRRKQCVALSRPRRFRLHQSVEFSPGDLPRPGRRCAGRRQCGGRQARRADAADGGACGRAAAEAGVPRTALHLVPGDGAVGASLVADPRISGVVFTGSTDVGRSIARALAAKDGPIVPLVAETGGINAMVVDATALPEQVTDDVIASAFRSAGQRCSALRLLCLQDDVAERMLDMLVGAAAELKSATRAISQPMSGR